MKKKTVLHNGVQVYYDESTNEVYAYSNACGCFELLKWISDEAKEEIKAKYKQQQ